jgi:hypothetical protein
MDRLDFNNSQQGCLQSAIATYRTSILKFLTLRRKLFVLTNHSSVSLMYTSLVITPWPTKLLAASRVGTSWGFRSSVSINAAKKYRYKHTYIAEELGVVILDDRAANKVRAGREVYNCRQDGAGSAIGATSGPIRDGLVDRVCLHVLDSYYAGLQSEK